MEKPPPAWSEAFKIANMVRAKTQEQADVYVEQGLLTAEQAAFLLDQYRRQDFAKRLEEAKDAYRATRRPGRRSIKDDPWIRQLHSLALEMKRADPRRPWHHIAEELGIEEQRLYRWFAVLGQ
jgi:hypothetical protein